MPFRKRIMRPRRRFSVRSRRRIGARRPRRTTRRVGSSRKTFNVIPNSLTTRLHFGDYYNFGTGAATYYSKRYRLNGCYDPEYAAGGGACSGFPELAALYGNYRVTGAKITVWFYSTCATALMCGIHAVASTAVVPSSGTGYQQLSLERPDVCRHRKLVPYGSGTSYPVTKVSFYKSVRSLEGPTSVRDLDYSAGTASNPVREVYFDVFLSALDGVTTNVTANASVEITYYIHFDTKIINYTD